MDSPDKTVVPIEWARKDLSRLKSVDAITAGQLELALSMTDTEFRDIMRTENLAEYLEACVRHILESFEAHPHKLESLDKLGFLSVLFAIRNQLAAVKGQESDLLNRTILALSEDKEAAAEAIQNIRTESIIKVGGVIEPVEFKSFGN